MEQYVGLDVSMEETSVCIIDKNGAVIFEGEVLTQPEAIAALLRQRAANVVRSLSRPAPYRRGSGMN